MFANLRCPTCGQDCRVPHNTLGQDFNCPGCLVSFSTKAPAPSILSQPALASAPAPPPFPNRTVLAEPEAMIRYTCPSCKKSLESPASFAGQKLNCPDCGQRLQIPQPSTPPPTARNKTVLATEEPAPRGTAVPPSAPGANGSGSADRPAALVAVASAPREACLECGADITQRARVQTCPDCGSTFCSAMCYRRHQGYDRMLWIAG